MSGIGGAPAPAAAGDGAGAEEIPRIGVGMLGYQFMGKAHSNAYRQVA